MKNHNCWQVLVCLVTLVDRRKEVTLGDKKNRFIILLVLHARIGVAPVGVVISGKMAIYIRLIMLLIKIILYPILKCLSSILGKLRKPIEQDYSCNIVLVTGAAQGIGKALAIEVSHSVCLMF